MTQASDNHASPHSRDGRSAGLLGIQRAAPPPGGRPRQRAAPVPRPARCGGGPPGRGVRTAPAQRLPLRQRRARQRCPGTLRSRPHRRTPGSSGRRGSTSRRPRGASPGRTVPGVVQRRGWSHPPPGGPLPGPALQRAGLLRELAVCIWGEICGRACPGPSRQRRSRPDSMPIPMPSSHGRARPWGPRSIPRSSGASAGWPPRRWCRWRSRS
jgi:hypothetical protein